MASTTANAAELAGAADLKGRMLDGEGFAKTPAAPGAVRDLEDDGKGSDPKRGVTMLQTEYAADYWQRRQKLIALAEYVAPRPRRRGPRKAPPRTSLPRR